MIVFIAMAFAIFIISISKIENTPAVKQAKFQDIFGDWLCYKASLDKKLIGITPAVARKMAEQMKAKIRF